MTVKMSRLARTGFVGAMSGSDGVLTTEGEGVGLCEVSAWIVYVIHGEVQSGRLVLLDARIGVVDRCKPCRRANRCAV